MNRRRAVGACSAVVFMATVGTSCSDFAFRSCERGNFATVVPDPWMWPVLHPGETMRLRGSYSSGDRSMPGENCAKLIDNTITSPGSFFWTSSDTTVATVSQAAVVARALGKTVIRVETRNETDTLEVTVVPPVASLRITASKVKANPGDTVEVSVEPLDAAGRLVDGALLAGPYKTQAYPDQPWLSVAASRRSARFIMPASGNVSVTWEAVHGPGPRVIASVTVTRP